MKRAVYIVVVLFLSLCLFSAAAWGSGPGTINCHKNGTGNSVGTVEAEFLLGKPTNASAAATACNTNYVDVCAGQCKACSHSSSGTPACCYDTQGNSSGDCSPAYH